MKAGYNESERTLVIGATLPEYQALARALRTHVEIRLDDSRDGGQAITGQRVLEVLRLTRGPGFTGTVHQKRCTLADDPEAPDGLCSLIDSVVRECESADLDDEEWHVHLSDSPPVDPATLAVGTVADVMICGPRSVYL